MACRNLIHYTNSLINETRVSVSISLPHPNALHPVVRLVEDDVADGSGREIPQHKSVISAGVLYGGRKIDEGERSRRVRMVNHQPRCDDVHFDGNADVRDGLDPAREYRPNLPRVANLRESRRESLTRTRCRRRLRACRPIRPAASLPSTV